MKTLVVIAHPAIETSVVHCQWRAALRQQPERFQVRELYQVYPDGELNIAQERALIAEHGDLVLQFPIGQGNKPPLANPLLSQWQAVFVPVKASATVDPLFQQRTLLMAVTADVAGMRPGQQARYRRRLQQFLFPFQMNALSANAHYRDFFAFYGSPPEAESEVLAQSARDYLHFLSATHATCAEC